MNEHEAKVNAIKVVMCDMFEEFSNSMFTPGITTRVINKYAPKVEEAVRQVELDREYAL
jgi:hypothetical protein